jgi:dihydrodipicolinate synthase/N-acetylneuraminate lyase
MNYSLRRGLNVPTISVVDEGGHVIEHEQRQVFRYVIQNGHGADVIFANGTTGEWNRLPNRERQRLLHLAVDEVQSINTELFTQGRTPVEVWCGINGDTKQEILANLDLAIQLNADAAVIAPLAINDLDEHDIVRFFRREVNDLIEAAPHPIPVFLYDNTDINAPGRTDHIRTHIVKELSRLPWLYGIKVSASRAVLGNYTKAALHYKQPGEFGIYIGNAGLIFDWYHPQRGFMGRLRSGWQEYLMHDALPIGVISGPGNVLPREWQKAWRVCWAGDEELTELYRNVCEEFENACFFAENGRRVGKLLACFKQALAVDGIIESALVCQGTSALTTEQRAQFTERYQKFRAALPTQIPAVWQSQAKQ